MKTDIACKKEQSIYETILASTNRWGKNTALIYMFHKFNYDHLLKRINQFAYSLKELGCKKGDVVTVCLPNIPDAIYLLYAINQIGSLANIVHPSYNFSQMEENVGKTKSKLLFCLDLSYQMFKPLEEKGVRVFSCSPTNELGPLAKMVYHHQNKKKIGKIEYKNTSKQFYFAKREREYNKEYLDDAVLLNSGGTSGKAKIIALSSFAMNALAHYGPWIIDVEDGKDIGMFAVLPMFHGFGLEMGVHIMLSFGAVSVLMPKFNRDQTIKYIKKGQIQLMIGIPIIYESLLTKKKFNGKILRNLNIAFVGGDFVSTNLLKNFNQLMIENKSKCRLREGYGLTETVCVCSVNTHHHHKAATSGMALPNVRFKVIDPNTMEDLGYDKEGELCISGETLMNGYRFADDPRANEKAFFVDKDGVKWLRTGDFVSLDKDNYVTFKQRLKRIVKVSGIPVFPSMVEDSASAYSFVYECAAIGVPDAKHGHIIKLFVVLHREYKGTIDAARKAIEDKIIRDLGIYAKPKEIVFIDKLPHTFVGKIDVNKLS
jgi:long-chain acyl-CoA synthetase